MAMTDERFATEGVASAGVSPVIATTTEQWPVALMGAAAGDRVGADAAPADHLGSARGMQDGWEVGDLVGALGLVPSGVPRRSSGEDLFASRPVVVATSVVIGATRAAR